MTQLFERCAAAFALDVPDGRVPVTDALCALVDQHRDTAATWLPGLADELRALSLGELDYAFMRQFYDDFAACQQEPDRLGIEDHFGFESRLRFVAVTGALERADGTALRTTSRVPSGWRRGGLRWRRRPRGAAFGSRGAPAPGRRPRASALWTMTCPTPSAWRIVSLPTCPMFTNRPTPLPAPR